MLECARDFLNPIDSVLPEPCHPGPAPVDLGHSPDLTALGPSDGPSESQVIPRGPVQPWHCQDQTIPDVDPEIIQWLQSLLPTYRFYFLTVSFKSGSGMKPASISKNRSALTMKAWKPRPEHFKDLFTEIVHHKIIQLLRRDKQKSIIIDLYDYEHGLLKGSRTACLDHIHCLLGAPADCNHDRLMRRHRHTLVPGSRRQGDPTTSPHIADVDLKELNTAMDIEWAYTYMRKAKKFIPVGGESALRVAPRKPSR